MSLLTTPTLQNLITDTRIMLNQRDPGNSFWQDDELTTFLNEGVRLYFLEVQTENEGYFTTAVSLDIAQNVDLVALPTDCFKVRTLYKKVSDGYVALPYRNHVTEGFITQGGTSGDNFLPAYYFRLNNLVLRPVPNFGEVGGLLLEYIQFPDNMVWGGDNLTSQVSPIFKNLIVAYAVYKAKLKESLVNGVATHEAAESHLATLYKAFQDSIPKRSKNPTFVIPFNPETEGSI